MSNDNKLTVRLSVDAMQVLSNLCAERDATPREVIESLLMRGPRGGISDEKAEMLADEVLAGLRAQNALYDRINEQSLSDR